MDELFLAVPTLGVLGRQDGMLGITEVVLCILLIGSVE